MTSREHKYHNSKGLMYGNAIVFRNGKAEVEAGSHADMFASGSDVCYDHKRKLIDEPSWLSNDRLPMPRIN